MTREHDSPDPSPEADDRLPEELFAWLEDRPEAARPDLSGLETAGEDLDDTLRVWHLTAAPAAPDGWSELNDRIDRFESQHRDHGRPAPRRGWFTPLRAAAVLVLAFGLGALASYLRFGREPVLPPAVVAVPAAGKATLELAGGIVVRLNAASTLSYVPSRGGVREVTLEGEAYFEVPHDPRREFVVHTAAGVVRDLGTEFNVWIREDSLAVAVTEGLVELEAASQVVAVQAGQSSHAARGRAPSAPEPIDPRLAGAWLEGGLVLRDQTLATVAAELERRYAVPFRVADELREQRLTATIRARSDGDAARAVCTAIGARCQPLDGGWSIEPVR